MAHCCIIHIKDLQKSDLQLLHFFFFQTSRLLFFGSEPGFMESIHKGWNACDLNSYIVSLSEICVSIEHEQHQTDMQYYHQAPATTAISYEKRRLWRDIDGPNPFVGKPRPEFDRVWRDIVARKYRICIYCTLLLIPMPLAMIIKVSQDELERFSEGDTTISFKDGSGFLAEMGVFHELHCIVCLNPGERQLTPLTKL